MARVVSINLSSGGIPKRPVEAALVLRDGLAGDRHDHEKHNTPLQAVSVIDLEDLEDLKEEGFDVYPGATGENLTVRDLDVDRLAPGDTLHFEGGVEIELTKRRQPCFVLDAISPDLKRAIVDRCGFYAKVVTEGSVRAGAAIEVGKAANRGGDQTPHSSSRRVREGA